MLTHFKALANRLSMAYGDTLVKKKKFALNRFCTCSYECYFAALGSDLISLGVMVFIFQFQFLAFVE